MSGAGWGMGGVIAEVEWCQQIRLGGPGDLFMRPEIMLLPHLLLPALATA